MLEAMGLLCELFPEKMYSMTTQLQTLYLDSLQKQFRSTSPGILDIFFNYYKYYK